MSAPFRIHISSVVSLLKNRCQNIGEQSREDDQFCAKSKNYRNHKERLKRFIILLLEERGSTGGDNFMTDVFQVTGIRIWTGSHAIRKLMHTERNGHPRTHAKRMSKQRCRKTFMKNNFQTE